MAENYAFLRFLDLTVIRGKAVTGAELKVTNTYSIDPQNYGLTALLTHTSWDASTLTWSRMVNNAEGAHGPERVDINANQPSYSFNVTSWAQGWATGADGEMIAGKWSPFGVTINTAGEAAYYELGAAENTVSTNRPELVVTYTNQTPNLITTLSPADGWVGTTSPQLTAVFSDPDDSAGKIEYKIDGILWGPYTTINGSTSPSFILGTGTHTWQVRGVDANQTGPWTNLRSFTINSLPNVPDQLSPGDGFLGTVVTPIAARFSDSDGWQNGGGTLEFEISQLGTFTVGSLANGAIGSVLPPVDSSPGTYSWRVRSKDIAGYYSSWSVWRTFAYYPAAERTRDEFSTNGSQWNTTSWTTSSGVNVSGNQGVFPVSTSSKRATAIGPILDDSEVSLTYAFPNRASGTSLRITLRGGPGTGSSQLDNGYRLDIPSGSTSLTLNKLVGGSLTQLSAFTDVDDPLNSAPRRLRFRVEGPDLYVKTWPLGALEPSEWDSVATDLDESIVAPGTLQIANAYQSAGRSVIIDDVTYSNELLPLNIVVRTTAQGPGGDVIECGGTTDRPHKSNTEKNGPKGRINVHAVSLCYHVADGSNAPVPYMYVEARLYRNGFIVGGPNSDAKNNRYSMRINAADRDFCVSNEVYKGWVAYHVQTPPGYTPTDLEGSGFNERDPNTFQC